MSDDDAVEPTDAARTTRSRSIFTSYFTDWSPTSSLSSVGNGPSPTRVVYAFVTPTTFLILVGPTPDPMVTPPAIGLDDVTNGYVPWSISSITPCAPSN